MTLATIPALRPPGMRGARLRARADWLSVEPSLHPKPTTCPPPRRRASRRVPGVVGGLDAQPRTHTLCEFLGRGHTPPSPPLGPRPLVAAPRSNKLCGAWRNCARFCKVIGRPRQPQTRKRLIPDGRREGVPAARPRARNEALEAVCGPWARGWGGAPTRTRPLLSLLSTGETKDVRCGPHLKQEL